MYCKKVKKGSIKCYKIKIGPLLFCKEHIPNLKTLPYSGCFTACVSAHFPVVKLGYGDQKTHCGMVPNGVVDSIEFQLTPLCGTEVLACSFDTELINYGPF